MAPLLDLDSLPRRPTRRRVIVASMLHQEVAILRWRLHELDEVVDEFVVVEADLTHSGQARELVLPHRRADLARFRDRLHASVWTAPAEVTDPWIREGGQRAALWPLGVEPLDPADDDLVIVSDVDEVPFPEVVDRLAWSDLETTLYLRPHWFNFDWDHYLGPWDHPSITVYTAGRLRRLYADGHERLVATRTAPGQEVAGLWGWHASWFGSDARLFDKLSSYAHADDPRDVALRAGGPGAIRALRGAGTDLFGLRATRADVPRLPRHAALALTPA